MNAEPARLAVPVGPDDHVRGAADAPVTLVEYGDFECPYCRQAFPLVRDLERRFEGKLRVVFRHFPLRIHRYAEAAAEASEFAGAHGRFWEMHDALFQTQDGLETGHLVEAAASAGLDGAALREALTDRTYAPLVEEQKESGEASDVPGTPAFYLNGLLFEDEPTALADAITYLLEHPQG